MTGTARWPLHPAPVDGEALSSWLGRIAYRYGFNHRDLGRDLGYELRTSDIDLAPPAGLAVQLQNHTGVDADRIRKMSITGWTPWLLDHVDPDLNAFTTYARQLAVLLPKGKRRHREVTSWRAWIPTKQSRRACPQCMTGTKRPHPYQLMWSLPLMLTCPFHHCLLEPDPGIAGYFFDWEDNPPTPRPATETVLAMDLRTWDALTTGWVELPQRRIHAGLWFRLLRTILDELSIPVSECGPAARVIRHVWDKTGRPVRAGQTAWHPYEAKPLDIQLSTLEAAATAIHLIETGDTAGRGTDAKLFLPQPTPTIEDASSVSQPDEPVDHWKRLADSLTEAVEDAQRNPDGARQLFRLMTWYREEADHLHEICNIFADAGIPLHFLSH